ncbi:MAG: diguanylate cyclase [Gammaproteobacteria bacterium]|nr:MAG: diguanylate cyclase [Gammaproteobacteria bacterium]RKZ42690.1 MAG: diguanylate cyclase [Gammaproteobacteria bacterium]RKZ75526.1 MAG: diguanylate cyclase [Gammaproteobacteria bacterium]
MPENINNANTSNWKNKSTILIVDDEQVSRYTVEILLSPEGYNLEFAENGEEALEKAEALVPDLMLLDVMMPGMDGFEVCQRLRNNKRLAELPIVMVTALDDRESRLRGLKAGADDFMSKPYDRAELRARVHTITRLNRYRRLVETEEQLAYLANYDTLTGLPNRNLLIERMRQTLDRAHRTHQDVAVLVLDLDNFQMVNDSLGHEVGDKVLCEIATRLTQAVSIQEATVARLSGDEFVVVFDTDNLVKEVSHKSQGLLDSISLTMIIDNQEMVITASIGISVYPSDGLEAAILLKNADTAISRAKAADKNTYQFFTTEMNQVALERLILENQLRKVLANDELRVYYQPQVESSSGQLIGMEALVRWQHPKLGLLSPIKFISVAEEMGLIVDIGKWVLQTACQQTKAWQRAGFPPIQISVNVSSRQFKPPHLLKTVKEALANSELHPIYLELELTESVLMEEKSDSDNGILGVLTDLRAMGVKIAIDDFGTGYSSLSYLKRFPVTTLKIDRSFVQDICTDDNDAAITTAIIAMAHSLSLSIVAEGVETLEQLAFLQDKQCEIIQGYYFSPPLPVEEMTHILEKVIEQPLYLMKNKENLDGKTF